MVWKFRVYIVYIFLVYNYMYLKVIFEKNYYSVEIERLVLDLKILY